MTLDKAIETLQDLDTMLPQFPPEMREAVKLLIEAGKRIKFWRQDNVYPDYTLLPGETEEMENDSRRSY